MSRFHDDDRALRRIERDSVVICLIATLGALAIDRGRLGLATGVLAGAAMMTFVYAAVRSAVDLIVGRAASRAAEDHAASPDSRRAIAGATVRFVGRYAIVAAVAVLALGPLGANPIGIFTGVSVPVVAIAIEAVRLGLARRSRERSW